MLLSIRPRHVNDIVAGRKTVELRRTRPSVKPGQPVAIYATTPAAALVATCRITRLDSGPPVDLWESVSGRAAVSRLHYDAYFQTAAVAYALHLDGVQTLESRVTLEHLRLTRGFMPPQTWRFLNRQQLEALMEGHPASEALVSLFTAGNAA